ncbi:MAG: hypothetical protein ACJA0U_002687 [Salibacteraceae bacterium]|jgi:hypothetical protein
MTLLSLILILFTSTYGALNAQMWSKSFIAGGYDSNNKLNAYPHVSPIGRK